MFDVTVHSGGDAAEQRGAEGRALVRCHDLEGDLQGACDDLEPERLLDPPPETRRGRNDPGIVNGVQAVTQRKRDTLQHRAGHRATPVTDGQAAERAACVRVGVRRPLAS